MQTRSGKVYTFTSSLEKNKTKMERNVDNRVINVVRPVSQPKTISNELAKLIGKPVGSKMFRTEVETEIIWYILAKNLQNGQNTRIINADEKLRKLLKLRKNDELTFFNLQKYLRPHFL
jgi:chromatin remodeling complex protein RSC6